MRNALTGCLGVVYHDAIAALGDVHLIRNLRRCIKEVSHQRNVQLRSIVERLEVVLARNQQHVHGGLRIGIFDSNDLFVVIYNVSRNVSSHDATEDATLFNVFHSSDLQGQLSTKLCNRVKHNSSSVVNSPLAISRWRLWLLAFVPRFTTDYALLTMRH